MITEHIWDTSGSIFLMESTCSAKNARWSQHCIHSKCDQPVIGSHIMVTLGQSFKMGVICNQWAHFGYSGSKHSECAQFVTIAYIVDLLRRTFKMYPIFNHWVHCDQVLSVPTMYSPCAHWVYGSLSPVNIEEAILLNNQIFTKKWEEVQEQIDCWADKHQHLKTHIIELKSLSSLQQTTLHNCQNQIAGLEETVEQLVEAIKKLEKIICQCHDWLLSPGLHYTEEEEEEVVVELEEEEDDEDGLEYETDVPLTASYITPPSTGGCSEPFPCLSHSATPEGSNPEDNAVLQTAEIKAQVEVFLEEVEEDMELGDLPPLENIPPILIPNLVVSSFIPFTVSTSQHCIPPKSLLPKVYHPYEGSIGQCSSQKRFFPQKV